MPARNVRTEEFGTAFQVDEVTTGPHHMLAFRHDAEESYFSAEGIKKRGGDVRYNLTWRTDATQTWGGYILDRMYVFASDGFGAPREEAVYDRPERYMDHDQTAHDALSPNDRIIIGTSKLTLRTRLADFLWLPPNPNADMTALAQRMGITTAEDIELPWIKGFYESTANPATKGAVAHEVGAVTTALAFFKEHEMGEPVLEHPDFPWPAAAAQ